MQSSKLGLQVWAIASYLLSTSLEGQSSMKLHRDLDITQKTAWHLAHCIRESWKGTSGGHFAGPIEVDETYIGGKRKNMPRSKRKELKGRGGAGKTIVAGAKDRDSNAVSAEVVEHTDAETLQGFVFDRAAPDATIYTDEAKAYAGMPFEHEAVKHSTGEYVRDQAHVNGMESFWSMLKRGYQGTYHHMSPEHLNRYVTEFLGRHNLRELDTVDQINMVAAGMVGKRLRYRDLVQ